MRKKKISLIILLFVLAVVINVPAKAQQAPPLKAGTDTAAIMRLIKTANMKANIDSSIMLFKQAAQMSVDGNFYLGAAISLCAAGSRYSDLGKYSEALSCCQQALPNAERSGSISQLAFCHNLFGVISFMQGDYVAASKEYFKALEVIKIPDSINYKAAISVYTNLVALSSRLGQKDKVLYYLNQGESIARNTQITHGKAAMLLAGILTNKGNYFERNHIPDSAIRYYDEVLNIANKIEPANTKRLRFVALAKINIASALLQTGEYEKAAANCREGISLASGKYAFIAAAGNYTLAEALRHLKKYKEAEAILLTAIKENQSSNTRDDAVKAYATLIAVYKDMKQYEKALAYTDTLIALNDSLVSAEKTKAVSQVEAKYNVADKDREIAKNELLIAQQKNNIAIKNLWITGIISVILLLAVILTAVYFISRQKQAALIKSLKQENTISVLKGVVQGEENERIRLARDLHDGIGGMLSATKMGFMALRHDNDALVSTPRYLEAMGLLDVMGDEIRKTSHNLMPEALLKQDLPEALRTYCNNIQSGTPLHIDFQSFGDFGGLPNDFKLNIYRIVQELLKNILQHAGATYTVVQLMMLEQYLTISVEDNGKGFNTGEAKDGIGLQNVKARILSHEGHYTVKSDTGKGTTVYIEFALPGKRTQNDGEAII